jgi:3-hydroxy-D-aspartate aldolase
VPDPRHCHQAANLHDWYVGIRNNRIDQLWPITPRGAAY